MVLFCGAGSLGGVVQHRTAAAGDFAVGHVWVSRYQVFAKLSRSGITKSLTFDSGSD